MRNLFDFIVKNAYVFLFIILEIFCFLFMYQSSSYRQWAINSSSKEISGPFLKARSTYKEYIHLKLINEKLQDENSKLISLVYNHQLYSSPVQSYTDSSQKHVFEYLMANVIENTTHLQSNYIILDKGSKDGIVSDMGVISQSGIVGIVKDVSSNFSIVLSVLHKDFSISAKLLNKGEAGILVWDGINHSKAILKNISSVENIILGDTVVVQHSLIFPENYPIGVVSKIDLQVKGGYYMLQIKLFEKMDRVNKVWIIKNDFSGELKKLKEKVKDE